MTGDCVVLSWAGKLRLFVQVLEVFGYAKNQKSILLSLYFTYLFLSGWIKLRGMFQFDRGPHWFVCVISQCMCIDKGVFSSSLTKVEEVPWVMRHSLC